MQGLHPAPGFWAETAPPAEAGIVRAEEIRIHNWRDSQALTGAPQRRNPPVRATSVQRNQNWNFIESWICREVPKSPAGNRVPPVISPKTVEPTTEFGCVRSF